LETHDHVTRHFSKRKKRRNARHVRPAKPRKKKRKSPLRAQSPAAQTNPIIRNRPQPKRPIKRGEKIRKKGRKSASPDVNSTDLDVEATTADLIAPVAHAVTTVAHEEMTTVSLVSLVNSGNPVNHVNPVNNVEIVAIDPTLVVDSDREVPRTTPPANQEVSDEWKAEVAEASREAEVKRELPRESLVEILLLTLTRNLMPRVRTCSLLWVTKTTIKLFPL